MKHVLDALPDILMPDVSAEALVRSVPLHWPDDEDLIRPDAEENLVRVAEAGALTRSGQAPLGKHLVWTFGPIHRALRFPFQLRFELDGDRIVTCDPEIGWTHLGLERIFANRSFDDGLMLASRLCPDNPIAPTLAYVLAVERLFDVDDDVPIKAQQVRVLCAELARIAAHLQVVSSMLTGISDLRARGAIVGAFQTVATLLNLVAFPDGVSILACVGGLKRDLADGSLVAIEKALPDALGPVADAQRALLKDPAFTDKLRGRGAISMGDAVAAGLSGPALRATGDDDDLRLVDAAFAYPSLMPRVVTQTAGDTLARIQVRWEEIQASSALVLRTVSALSSSTTQGLQRPDTDEGDVTNGEKGKGDDGGNTADGTNNDGAIRITNALARNEAGKLTPPPGRAVGSIEAPGGELVAFIDHVEGDRPRRVRWKTPSFSLASVLPSLLEGQRVDDVIPVLLSLGIQASGLDR